MFRKGCLAPSGGVPAPPRDVMSLNYVIVFLIFWRFLVVFGLRDPHSRLRHVKLYRFFFLPGSGDCRGVENEEITGSTFSEAGVLHLVSVALQES